jgi:ABC-type antimicrobial peptide transport system permease subunit
MMVSKSLADIYWPNQNPIGQTARVNGSDCTVVGVVADVLHGLEKAPQPDMYLSYRQWNVHQWSSLELMVRSQLEPDHLIAEIRTALKRFDAALPGNDYIMLGDIVDRAIAPRRLTTNILGSFSCFALLLAAIGLYGVIAYLVGQRTQEIGIRQALGAQRGDVLRLIAKEGLRLVGVGIAVGLVVAFFVTRVLQSQLYGVTPADPLTYATTALVLVAVTLSACYVPARRASKIDPMEALRYE